MIARVARVARELASGRRSWRDVVAPRLVEVLRLLSRPLVVDTSDDPYHRTIRFFVSEANRSPGYRLLELGSRGSRFGSMFEGCTEYIGVDIHPGPGVDVVGDVHELSGLVQGPFDFAFAISTFEHLVLPWKAVLEINAVVREGGLLLVTSHPAWPPHELPWDFWRFSCSGFEALLNRHSGWEIIRCAEGLPGLIVPLGTEESTRDVHRIRVSMGVAVVARKIGSPDPRLSWDLTAAEVLSTSYPLPSAAKGST